MVLQDTTLVSGRIKDRRRAEDSVKRYSCAFVSVLEEYSGHRRPGELLRLLMILSTFSLLMSLIILS